MRLKKILGVVLITIAMAIPVIAQDDNPPHSWMTIDLGVWERYITTYTEFTIFAEDEEGSTWSIHFSIAGPENAMFYYMGGYYPCDGTWYEGLNNTPVAFQIRDAEGFAPSGKYFVRFYAEDEWGNIEDMNVEMFTMDVDPPVTSLVFEGSNYGEWISSETFVAFESNDAGAGVQSIMYRIDDGSWQTYYNKFKLNGGEHVIYYYAKDRVGNVEAYKEKIVVVDDSPPETTIKFDGNHCILDEMNWISADTAISFISNDEGCGIKSIYYSIDRGEWKVYKNAFKISDEGKHEIKYYSIDNVDNKEEIKSIQVCIDKDSPSINLYKPKEKYLYIHGKEIMPLPSISIDAIVIGPLEIKATADDSTGISEMKLYIDGDLIYSSQNGEMNYVWNERALFKHTVEIVAYDAIGMSSTMELNIAIFNL